MTLGVSSLVAAPDEAATGHGHRLQPAQLAAAQAARERIVTSKVRTISSTDGTQSLDWYIQVIQKPSDDDKCHVIARTVLTNYKGLFNPRIHIRGLTLHADNVLAIPAEPQTIGRREPIETPFPIILPAGSTHRFVAKAFATVSWRRGDSTTPGEHSIDREYECVPIPLSS
jgi:hypothetical protein